MVDGAQLQSPLTFYAACNDVDRRYNQFIIIQSCFTTIGMLMVSVSITLYYCRQSVKEWLTGFGGEKARA